jgi:hypothetical protein
MKKTFVIPSDQATRDKIKDATKEISDSLTRIASERDLIKDILDTVEEKYGIPKAITRKMGKIYFKGTFDAEVAEADDFSALYETVLTMSQDGETSTASTTSTTD